MREIVAADALKAEMLEEARARAAQLLKTADEAAAREIEAGSEAAADTQEAIGLESARRVERMRADAESREPLDFSRAATDFVDARMREAARDFLTRLPEAEVARLAAAMVARAAPFFADRATVVAVKGLDEASALEASSPLGPSARISSADAEEIWPRGLFVETVGGEVSLHATMDLVEEALLEGRREELARALCREALILGALDGGEGKTEGEAAP